MKNNIGVIGCGAVVQKNYFNVFEKNRHLINNIFFFDLNKVLASNIAKKTRGIASDTLEETIINSDFIIIATPPSTHFTILTKSILNGKIVLCEKPFLYSTKEFDEILQLQKNINCKLFVGHFRRTFAHVKKAKEIVKSGLLGAIKKISLFEGGRFNWVAESNYTAKDLYGGVLFDTGSHTLDTGLFIANLDKVDLNSVNITKIHADKDEPSNEIKANFNIIVNEYKDNIEFDLFLSRHRQLSNQISIIGENAKLIVSTGLNPNIILQGGQGSFCIKPENPFVDYMDYFNQQFNDIIDNKKDSLKFYPERFYNLTKILEALIKHRVK